MFGMQWMGRLCSEITHAGFIYAASSIVSLSKIAHGRRKMGTTDDGNRPVPGHVSLAVKPNQPEDDGKYGVPDVALPNAALPLA
jgi:hypothetical protein